MSITFTSGYVPPEQQFFTGEVDNLDKSFDLWNAECPPRPEPDRSRAALLDTVRRAKQRTIAAGGNHIEVKTVCAEAMINLHKSLMLGLESLSIAAAPLSKICLLLAVGDNSLKVEAKNDFLRKSVITRDLQKWMTEPSGEKGNPLKQLAALEIVALYGLSEIDYNNFLSIANNYGIFGRLQRYLSDPDRIVNENPPPAALWSDMMKNWCCLIDDACPRRNPHEIIK